MVVVVELGVVVVDWLGVVVVDCDGVTPVADGAPCVAEGLVCVADGIPGVAEGLVCVADGLPTVPAPPGAVAVVPDVPVVPGVPVVCAAATPIASMSTNDAHIDFFIRCRSFAASSAEIPVIAKVTYRVGCHARQAGMAQVGPDRLLPVQCSTSQTCKLLTIGNWEQLAQIGVHRAGLGDIFESSYSFFSF